MQKVGRERFFDSYRKSYGSISQATVDGLETLLAFLEGDDKVTDLRHAAYMLATTKRECGNSFKPVKEVGQGKGKEYGKPDPVTGKVYFGRGFVQLTWKDNYEAMSKVTGKDLVHNPDLALEPATAYHIMSYGMRTGAFTGVGLNRYIHGDVCNYFQARKIINSLDCADMIAGYAVQFEKALKAGVW